MKIKLIKNIQVISIIVIAIMLITKALSFIRDMKITAVLGATYKADAYNIAYLLAITLFGFIGSAYSNSIMPVASDLYLKDKYQMQKTINNILSINTLIVAVIILLFWIFPGFFVKFMASGASLDTYGLASQLLKSSIFSLLFLVWVGVISITLRVYDVNIIPAIAELFFPMPIVIGLIVGIKSVNSLIYLMVLGYMVQAGINIIALIKVGFKFSFLIDLKDKNLIRVIKLMPPILLSTGLLQINTVIDNQVASRFGVGSITSLSLAAKINGLAYTVFSTSLMRIIYGSLSKAYASGDINEYQRVINKQVNLILSFIIPATICMLLFNNEIVNFLFVRGNYTENNARIAESILFGYTSGLIIFVLRDVCNYIFYSANNSILPSFSAGVAVVVNIILCLLLSEIIGIQGVAYATSIASAISLGIMIYALKNTLGNITIIGISDLMLYLFSASVMIFFIFALKRIVNPNLYITFIIMVAGTLVFWLFVYTGRKLLTARKTNRMCLYRDL